MENFFQTTSDVSQSQNYYVQRETMLQRKQQYFKSILQQLDLSSDQNEVRQKFIVDSTNQQLELPNCLDLKFATSIPNTIDDQIKYIILNETIDAQHLDYEVLQHQCQPQYNLQTEFLWEEDVERIDQVYNYLQKFINEELDVAIYCKDINEIESFKDTLEHLGNIQIRLTPEFNEFYTSIDGRKQSNESHTIYLLLEPQYLNSEYITLIIQTQFRQQQTQYINNSVSYQTQLLSKQELIIREIPKSNLVGVKIIYTFPEEVFIKLPGMIVNETTKTEFYNLSDKTKHSIIIKAVLDTNGTLLQRNKNIGLIVRTCNLWSSKGDPYSWIEIIEYIGQQLNSIKLNVQIDKNQGIFELIQLEKWCQDNIISFLKGITVLLYVKQFAAQHNLPNIDILSEFNLQPIRRSSSMQIAQEDKPQVEEQLKLNFPVAELKQDKLYHIGEQQFEIDPFCIQKQKGRLQSHILVLAIRDNKILYLHNKNRKQSIAQKEIVLHNIGNAILEELWKNEGIEIISFENKLNCTIEPNPDLNLITIYSDDQLDISELNNRIEQVKQALKTQIMEVKHQSGKKLIFQSGAVITEWIKEHEQKDFQVHNLSPNTTEADIKELFDDFTTITHLKLNYLADQAQAYIVIEDKDDLPYIIQAYDQSEVQGRFISIITDKKQNEVKKNNFQQKYQIKIIWYVKHCVDSCIVISHNKEHAEQCQKQFDNQMLDGRKIKVTQIDEVTIKFSNLSPITTEYDILMLCGGKTKVKFVDIQSKNLPESKEDYSSKILSLINFQLENKERRFILHHSNIIRKQGGKRKLIVNIENTHVMQKLLEQLNNSSIQLGPNFIKVHLKPIYTQVHKVQPRLKSYITSLLKFNDLKFKVNFEEIQGAKQSELTMIVQTYNILVHQQLDQFITNKLSGQQIDVAKNSDFLFTAFGLKKLKELEQQNDNVVFMADQNKKILRICCQEDQLQEIVKQVNEITQSLVTHKLHLSPGALKELVGVKGQGLENLKKQFNLTQIKYKQQGKELFLEGSGQSIQDAVACIEAAIGQIYQDESQTLNQADCPICYDSIKHSYLIQGCGHKCCKECISLHCQGVLQDMKLLPVRCPICNEAMLLNDIIPLIGQENMKILQDLSINKFVQDNIKTISFCFTPACNNFEEIQDNNVLSCAVCEKSYCLLCKALRHPGMTCEENKIGDQVLLQKLMKEQDIRKCPSCQALIQRIDGCYRVTCSVCKQSICWKNDKNGKPCMQVFKTASECYDHLTKMHNGYW